MMPKELGAKLKAARLAAGLTQLDVAIRLRLARSTVSMIESGSRPLRDGELSKLATLYGVSVASLTAQKS